MKIVDRLYTCAGRGERFDLYPLGDLHVGSRSCAEKPLRKLVKQIQQNDNAIVLGGGDWADAIRPQDTKRFDFDTLPDWLIEGDAMTTREQLNDIVQRQIDRLVDVFSPVKDKIIGLIEGNHEYTIRKYMGLNIHAALCRRLNTENLTDEALLRLRWKRENGSGAVVIIYLRHGYGGGRTPGAEPNKLDRMLNEWECADICLTGHTHNADELPPKPVLHIPRRGKLSPECLCKYRYAANWGCWLYSHPAGPSSYASRACYPARPMLTYKVSIRPYNQQKRRENGNLYCNELPEIEIRKIPIT